MGQESFNPTTPYDRLADDNGTYLPIYTQYRKAFVDTAGSGHLLNWTNVPLDELQEKPFQKTLNEYKADFDINYKIVRTLNITASYQFTKGHTQQVQDRDQNSYYVRDLINQFSQVNYSTGEVIRPIPLGNIRKQYDNDYSINYGRAQLNFNEQLGRGYLSAIGGFEIRNYNSNDFSFTQYGYDPATGTSLNVNTTSYFPSFVNGQDLTISALPETAFSIDNSISYYANASYTYANKYTVSGSARRDESNLFGVKANQKGVPLWSVGISWNLTDESLFKTIEKFPNIKLRLTTGYNGNLIKSLSAYTTANISDYPNPLFLIPFAEIVNPPNPSLAWEKVHTTNLGLDVSTKNNRISVTLEFYNKKGTDLIGKSPIAPQTGVSQITGNNAAVLTKGLEASIHTLNMDGNFKWKTFVMINYVADKVITNKNPLPFNSSYIDGNYQSPMEGKPYSALFAYPTGSLDNLGNPQGYLNGQLSENYSGIRNSTNINDLKYIGSATPTLFGSLLNSFSYKEVDFSFNIGYKGGYYFRRTSFVANPANYRMPDYEKRWQNPGDENITFVPSIIYPLNSNRDAFYQGSDKLVLKGDHIRLRDIQVSYTIHNDFFNRLGLTNFKVYSYITNINLILWRANNLKLDPDYMGFGGAYLIKAPCTFSFGLQCNLK